MKSSDKRLGMDAEISRRDFLNGVSVAVGASLLPGAAAAEVAADVAAQDVPGYYPPELTGLRGSHPGSFKAAHLTRDGMKFAGEDTGERYDLVVVGGGISGLSAAYFYRKSHGEDARILILDNHDDFGGHAKRNEFQIDGRTIIGYGGTMYLESPGRYPPRAKELITDLGIKPQRYDDFVDDDLYSSLGLSTSTFFDKETFGADHLAVGRLSNQAVLDQTPLSEKARVNLARLLADDRHYLQDMPKDKRRNYLENISYLAYLKDRAGMDDEVLKFMLPKPRSVWAINSDAFPASIARYEGYAGFGDQDRELEPEESDAQTDDSDPQVEGRTIFHFPDGNATVARLLVRAMIPAAASGDNMEDIVTTRLDYGRLDDPKSSVRIRLNSTAVRAQHIDDDLSKPVRVTYVRNGTAHVVETAKVIMACYNSIIPRLCPEMPEAQKSALSNCIRAPLVYTNVLIRNWTSFAKLGVRRISCPGCYHHDVTLDFPVSISDYQFAKSPKDPIVLHLTRVPGQPGLSAREQFKAGMRDLLATSFETYERSIRDQLSRILGPGGFDAARDIAGITVNRWPHGYAYGHDPENDRIAFYPSTWPKGKRPWEIGRRPFGNIAIASTDSASNAMTEAAIEQAHRAVGDLH